MKAAIPAEQRVEIEGERQRTCATANVCDSERVRAVVEFVELVGRVDAGAARGGACRGGERRIGHAARAAGTVRRGTKGRLRIDAA